jgi:hypothetical protein
MPPYLSDDDGVLGRRVSVPVVGEPQALGQTQAGQYKVPYLSEDEGVPGRQVSVSVVGEPQALGQTQAGQYTVPLP